MLFDKSLDSLSHPANAADPGPAPSVAGVAQPAAPIHHLVT